MPRRHVAPMHLDATKVLTIDGHASRDPLEPVFTQARPPLALAPALVSLGYTWPLHLIDSDHNADIVLHQNPYIVCCTTLARH